MLKTVDTTSLSSGFSRQILAARANFLFRDRRAGDGEHHHGNLKVVELVQQGAKVAKLVEIDSLKDESYFCCSFF